MKDGAREALDDPERRRIHGVAAQSVFVALLLTAANLRKIGAHLKQAAAGAAGVARRLPRRRRTRAIAEWLPERPPVAAPGTGHRAPGTGPGPSAHRLREAIAPPTRSPRRWRARKPVAAGFPQPSDLASRGLGSIGPAEELHLPAGLVRDPCSHRVLSTRTGQFFRDPTVVYRHNASDYRELVTGVRHFPRCCSGFPILLRTKLSLENPRSATRMRFLAPTGSWYPHDSPQLTSAQHPDPA